MFSKITNIKSDEKVLNYKRNFGQEQYNVHLPRLVYTPDQEHITRFYEN